MLVDSHIHLTHSSFEGTVPCIVSSEKENRIEYMDRSVLIDEFKRNNIAFCVEPGIDFESNYKILDIAEKYPNYIYPAIGIHPTRTFKTKWSNRKQLNQMIRNERVVAVGELGLDYHYKRTKQHRLRQKLWFIWQLKTACKIGLPLILHIRQADIDAIRILRRYKGKIPGGVCHCYNRGLDLARIYTEEFGFMLGIGGTLLQQDSSSIALEQVVSNIPLEYLILETDGPFVKPQGPVEISKKKWKKARNTSLILEDVAERIAELKGIDVCEVERVTTDNVVRLFQINT